MRMTSFHFDQLLESKQIKRTPGRIALLQIVEDAGIPVDTQYIIEALQAEHAIDRATIFRILQIFVAKGILRKLEFREGKARFELASFDHHHLICESCNNIEDLSDCNIPALEEDILRKKGFFVKQHSLEFFGLCKKCFKKKKGKKS